MSSFDAFLQVADDFVWNSAGPREVLDPMVQVEFPDPAWGVDISVAMQSLLSSVSCRTRILTDLIAAGYVHTSLVAFRI
jgi:hypothetical protein